MKDKLNNFNTKDLAEHPTQKGFYQIPGASNYYFSKTGDLYSEHRKKVLPPRKIKPSMRYEMISLRSDSGESISTAKHRLLASMFLNDGTDKTKMQVDHIDGNRFNNSLDNLEWVTPSENVKRSFKLGLRDNSCVAIEVRNYKTGEVTKYNSLGEASLALGLHYSTIAGRCKFSTSRVYPDGYQYRFASDPTPWDKCDIDLKYGIDVPVLVKDHATGEIKRFFTSHDAAVYCKLSPSAISNYVNDPTQPLSEDLLQFKRDDDSIPWREVEDPYLDLLKNSAICPVTVTDSKTGKQYHFVKSSYAAAFAGILTTTLHWRLNNKDAGNKVYHDGFTYKYYDGK